MLWNKRTFWTEIASNKRWSFFLSFLMALLLAAVGAAGVYLLEPDVWWAGAAGAFAIGVLLWILLNAYGDRLLLSISDARPATAEEDQVLVNVGQEMALAAGIPMPKIYVIEDTSPNAFATGMRPKRGVICVTTGLLQKLSRDELQGVIAHEMSHIRNYDSRLLTTLALTVGLIVLFRDAFWRIGTHSGRRSKGSGNSVFILLAILLIVLAPIFATLLKLAVSRKREYLADAGAAQFTRFPNALADALEKLTMDTEMLEAANNATAHMYIVNPIKKIGLMEESGIFSTHPPTAERIRRLRAMGLAGFDDAKPGAMPDIPMQPARD